MKYIIDVPEGFDYIIAYYSDNDGFPVAFTTVRAYDAEPYTEPEPDRDQIHVGDEVEYESCGDTFRFVVTEIKDEVACGFRFPCSYNDPGEFCEIDGVYRTGRSFPEIAEVLERMKDIE